jgi:hypothetical protein
MTKAFSIFIVLAMTVQVIRPIGLPGLKKRSDFWKDGNRCLWGDHARGWP